MNAAARARGPDPRIDADLVRALVADQFPAWAGLPVRPVDHDGWDNRTFRLGDDLSVRMPSARGYVEQVAKEHAWLPRLAPQLPLPIPEPVARGVPGCGYPFPWSVYRWLEGTPLVLAVGGGGSGGAAAGQASGGAAAGRATDGDAVGGTRAGTATGKADPAPATGGLVDPVLLARDLGAFLGALRRCDTTGAPPPGTHNFFRGAPPAVYEEEALAAFALLGPDASRAR